MGSKYVSFVLGKASYCIPVDQVTQIIRDVEVLEVPKAPPFVKGVINIRGDVIPVIDMYERFGMEREDAAEPSKKRRIIVAQIEQRFFGLLVDEVREVFEQPESTIERQAVSFYGVKAEFIYGIAKRNDQLFIILDLPRVLTLT